MLSLSDETSDVLRFKVHVNNLPYGVSLVDNPDSTVVMHLRATGYQLLTFRFGMHSRQIDLDLGDFESELTVDGKSRIQMALLPLVSSQLPQGNKQISITLLEPDSLLLWLEPTVSKKVKIVPVVTADFSADEGLVGEWLCEPDSVIVSGASTLVNQVSEIRTLKVSLNKTENIVEISAGLMLPNSLLSLSLSDVMIRGEVDRFTEKILDKSVPSYTNEAGEEFMVLPSRVKIVASIALSKFNQVDEADFQLQYKPSDAKNLLELNATSKLPYAKVLRVEPSEVEFFKLN